MRLTVRGKLPVAPTPHARTYDTKIGQTCLLDTSRRSLKSDLTFLRGTDGTSGPRRTVPGPGACALIQARICTHPSAAMCGFQNVKSEATDRTSLRRPRLGMLTIKTGSLLAVKRTPGSRTHGSLYRRAKQGSFGTYDVWISVSLRLILRVARVY